MHFTTPLIVLSSLALPYLTLADPVAQVAPPDQTIVPFTTLPACSKQCGLLWDVQGACSPPKMDASGTKNCFCTDARLTAFKTGVLGVCDAAQCDAASLSTIQKWYQTLCGVPTTNGDTTSSGAASTGKSGSSSNSTGAKNGNSTWISTHVQWVIMAVIVFVAIVGGWVGAYLLRRRYLQRKERQYELRPPGTPWIAGSTKNHSPYGDGIADTSGSSKEARSGVLATPASVKGKSKNRLSVGDSIIDSYLGEKPKRKWRVSERT